MNLHFLRHTDDDTGLDELYAALCADVRQQILLNTLRALGTFSREQVGPEFGAMLIGGLIEKIGKDQYKVK